MQKALSYIITLLFLAIGSYSNGQAILLDTLRARQEREEYFFIIAPAHYEKLSKKLNLTDIKSTDSFSLRLWTGHMFGYSLMTFDKRNIAWDSHSYRYYSDTSLKELKLDSKISTAQFVNKLRTFNFDNYISQHQIKDFQDNIDDGIWYTLEIIKGQDYKVFQYHSPSSFNDPDNREFYELIKLLDKYFHTKD